MSEGARRAREAPASGGGGRAWRGGARWAPLVLLAGLAVLAYALGLHRWLSLTALAEHRGALAAVVAANRAGALAAFVAIYAVAVALSLPGAAPLTLAGGLLFGWWQGGLASLGAATLGSAALFLAARSSLGGALRARAGDRASRLAQGFRERGWTYLLALRLAPVFPFWLVNLAAAIVGVPFGTFVATTLAGCLPGSLAFAAAGSGLGEALEHGAERLATCRANGETDCAAGLEARALLDPALLWGLGALALASLLPLLLRRRDAGAGAGAGGAP